MKRSMMLVGVLAVSALTSQVAMANPDLAKAKNCMACHAVGSKLVGPAYKDGPPSMPVKKTRKTSWWRKS